MAFTDIRRASIALVLALVATACTVKDTEAPPLTGPSQLALTLNVLAVPDSISQDGGSQAAIRVTAIGPDGKPQASVPVRMDMAVNGVPQDYGKLSARALVTNADGVASVVYTAPPSPPNGVFGTCKSLPGNCVTIVATATGSNFVAANPQEVEIRLVPTGVILPPGGSPTLATPPFTMSPTTALANVPVTFDASGAAPGTGATSITSYAWNFGDGTAGGSGRSVTHTFGTQQTFNVTLTVTNDRGASTSGTIPVAVGGLAAPLLRVVFSPASPQAGQSIVFNAEQSTAAPGHTLTSFNWNFGDGATGTGLIASHAFTAIGTYNVVLTALDDTGQRASTSVSVAVTSGGGTGGGSTAAAFVASPTAPVANQIVFFNASGSTASTGHTLVKYAWDFGDGTAFAGTTASASHIFTTVGTYTVILVVTDDTGQTAKSSSTVAVAAAGAVAPTARFVSSPGSPGVNQTVFFNASSSTAGAGHSLTNYAWDYGDGGTGSGVSPSHAYTRAGSFTVVLVVTDEASQTGTVTGTVTVIAASSQIVAAFGFSPVAPDISDGTNVVHFDATPSIGQGTLTYDWNWGDGTAATSNGGALLNHTFTVAGTYVVRLTVTDSTGATATTTVNVPVVP